MPKFSCEEEDVIIEFLKKHEILHNVRHKEYRDAEKKNRLWYKLSEELNADVEVVKKKWAAMRDYFMRNQKKKSSGHSVNTRIRDEKLNFLLKYSAVMRPTLTNIDICEQTEKNGESNSNANDECCNKNEIFEFIDAENLEGNEEYAELDWDPTSSIRYRSSSSPPSKSSKRRKIDSYDEDPKELNRQQINRKRPEMSQRLPEPPPKDSLDLFFSSISDTMRKWPNLLQAKTKLQISQIIGEIDIKFNEENESVSRRSSGIKAEK